jgi:hypothetical protein
MRTLRLALVLFTVFPATVSAAFGVLEQPKIAFALSSTLSVPMVSHGTDASESLLLLPLPLVKQELPTWAYDELDATHYFDHSFGLLQALYHRATDSAKAAAAAKIVSSVVSEYVILVTDSQNVLSYSEALELIGDKRIGTDTTVSPFAQSTLSWNDEMDVSGLYSFNTPVFENFESLSTPTVRVSDASFSSLKTTIISGPTVTTRIQSIPLATTCAEESDASTVSLQESPVIYKTTAPTLNVDDSVAAHETDAPVSIAPGLPTNTEDAALEMKSQDSLLTSKTDPFPWNVDGSVAADVTDAFVSIAPAFETNSQASVVVATDFLDDAELWTKHRVTRIFAAVRPAYESCMESKRRLASPIAGLGMSAKSFQAQNQETLKRAAIMVSLTFGPGLVLLIWTALMRVLTYEQKRAVFLVVARLVGVAVFCLFMEPWNGTWWYSNLPEVNNFLNEPAGTLATSLLGFMVVPQVLYLLVYGIDADVLRWSSWQHMVLIYTTCANLACCPIKWRLDDLILCCMLVAVASWSVLSVGLNCYDDFLRFSDLFMRVMRGLNREAFRRQIHQI